MDIGRSTEGAVFCEKLWRYRSAASHLIEVVNINLDITFVNELSHFHLDFSSNDRFSVKSQYKAEKDPGMINEISEV